MTQLLPRIIHAFRPGYDESAYQPLPTRAMLEFWSRMLPCILRGSWCRLWFRRAEGLVFVGKGVTIRNPEYISAGKNLFIDDGCEIQGLSQKGVVLGNNVTIRRLAMVRPSGLIGGELGVGLQVGENTSIGPYSYLGASGGIEIGSHVMISPRVSIYSEEHEFSRTDIPMRAQGTRRRRTKIEDDCWLASNSVILAGVTIQHGALVCAGAVVTKDVPAFAIVAGVPARVIGSRMPA